MKLVVDANVLFSSLITDGKTIELFMNESFSLCAPEFVLEEIEEHKAEIISKSKRSEKEFDEIFSLLKSLINIVPKE
jgi:predicted nucleic acid-binding protein